MKKLSFEKHEKPLFSDTPTWKGKVKETKLKGYFKKPKSSGGKKGNTKKISPRLPRRDFSQQCVVKTSTRYSKKLHAKNLDYIQREGKGRDGEKAELYGSLDYEDNLSDKHYRLIISPENQDVDMTLLTELTIKQIEKETGYKLRWTAANHYDKPHQHSHVLINGIDKNGNPVNFSTDMLSKRIRSFSKEISTSLVGLRSIEDIRNSELKQSQSNYYTRLDTILQQRSQNGFISEESVKGDMQNVLHKRLITLTKLKLAQYNQEKEGFDLAPNWQETLKLYGRYNTFLTGFSYCNCDASEYSLHNVKQDGNIQGKIVKRFFLQEDSNTHAVILQNDTGFHFVPLPFGLDYTQYKDSDDISIYVSKNRDPDKPNRIEVSRKR